MTSPCKNCEKRQIGCHATCEAYISYKKEMKRVNDVEKQEIVTTGVLVLGSINRQKRNDRSVFKTHRRESAKRIK